jgi:hypothetical protein
MDSQIINVSARVMKAQDPTKARVAHQTTQGNLKKQEK